VSIVISTVGESALRCVRRAALLVLAGLAGGCAAPPTSVADIAAGAGLERRIVAGERFRHVVFTARGEQAGPVWIYIEGDGVPWLTDVIPARDPTPRTLVALEMLARGPRPAAYVARPCTFETNGDAGCEPAVWTHGRFSEAVVESMASAIGRSLAASAQSERPLVLVGFSGGGTLATLLAARLEAACALITIASPLDVGEWAAARDYSPLADSLDPARLPALPARIGQLHLRGRDDRVVPAANGASYMEKNPHARLEVLDSARHGLEWAVIWEGLARAPGRLPLQSCAER
jgi:hypothetical protein